MSQKRMFDRAIIQTDRFMDLSMSSKALYFLLGMEADDEGFVSYKMVMRIHGGNEDDIKVLVAKGFLIMFESGVVVVTDWHTNNYLNKTRIKPTRYQTEKIQLSLIPIDNTDGFTNDKKYVFNTCSTRREEKRIEQNRREEKSAELPEGINALAWKEWETYRKEKKQKLTPTSIKKQLAFLVKHLSEHEAILEQSIQNGWTGLFEIKRNYQPKNIIQPTTNKYDKYSKN